MKLDELVNTVRETATARRVFAEPYTQDGTTVIPAARISGGAGGGAGHDRDGQEGEGGGFGLQARPAGVYVVKDGAVRWLPAVDANRVVAVVGAVVITFLITRVRLAKLRAKLAARSG